MLLMEEVLAARGIEGTSRSSAPPQGEGFCLAEATPSVPEGALSLAQCHHLLPGPDVPQQKGTVSLRRLPQLCLVLAFGLDPWPMPPRPQGQDPQNLWTSPK